MKFQTLTSEANAHGGSEHIVFSAIISDAVSMKDMDTIALLVNEAV